jgi:carboxymethylenebutenolidase
MTPLKTPAGAAVPGHFIRGGSGAVVLVHEYWGLNAHIRDVALRFADRGLSVLAIDLFDGKVATDAPAAELLAKGLDRGLAVQQLVDARAALKKLMPGGKTAVVGFCLGGGLALEAALAADFAGAVSFYGLPKQADWAALRCPVQGHFADQDEHCSPARVAAAEVELGKRATFFHYAAKHAFFNDTRPEVFSAADAELAFGRTTRFLDEVLS